MSVQRFLNVIRYANECPSDIYIGRWKGMMLWFKTRVNREEDFICD